MYTNHIIFIILIFIIICCYIGITSYKNNDKKKSISKKESETDTTLNHKQSLNQNLETESNIVSQTLDPRVNRESVLPLNPDLEPESIPGPDIDPELEIHLMDENNSENDHTYSNKIKQFKINHSDTKNSSIYIENIKTYDMSFPLRVRDPLDIIGAVHYNESWERIDSIQGLVSIGKTKSRNGYVVQEIVPGNQYIISCFDGIVDKIYQKKKNKVMPISLKNICLENKKYMREIIKKQHAKIGTVKGIFEIGFISTHPTVPFNKDPLFKFVGINVAVNARRDKGYLLNDAISYPINDDNL